MGEGPVENDAAETAEGFSEDPRVACGDFVLSPLRGKCLRIDFLRRRVERQSPSLVVPCGERNATPRLSSA